MSEVKIKVEKSVKLTDVLKERLKPIRSIDDFKDIDSVTIIGYSMRDEKYFEVTHTSPSNWLRLNVGAVYFNSNFWDINKVLEILNDNHVNYDDLVRAYKELGWL